MATTIIAEAGISAGRSLAAAMQLAEAAKIAGANAVKFQIAIPELETTAAAPVAPYQAAQGVKSQRDMIRDVMMSFDDFDTLTDYCHEIGIEFMASAGDCKSLEWLLDCRIKRIKIGSGDLTNGEMLTMARKSSLPVILSTGMATVPEIHQAMEYLGSVPVTLLQCTSSYPCPPADVNLAVMAFLRREFCVPVGFSDHTSGFAASIAAAALGARVIEKHITLNRMATGPDHSASLEPGQFKFMVDLIREAEQAMGVCVKEPTKSEMANAAACRKVLVASRAIAVGEAFTPENLTAKRSHAGRSALEYRSLLGSVAERNYAADESI